MKTPSQKQRLLEYLETGKTINPLESWRLLSIYRLADVVFKLKKDGHEIETIRKTINNQYGEKCSFAEYRLIP